MTALACIGIGVADPDGSALFYRKALGFSEGKDGLLRLGGSVGIAFHPADKAPAPAPNNRIGPVNLNLAMPDLDAAIDAIRAGGGQVFDATRVEFWPGGPTMVMTVDPDGTRIVLNAQPGAPPAFAFTAIAVRSIDAVASIFEALGFARAENYDLSGGSEALARHRQLPGIKVRGQFLRDVAGGSIELVEFGYPPVMLPALGQSGISRLVLDAAGAGDALVALGARDTGEAYVFEQDGLGIMLREDAVLR